MAPDIETAESCDTPSERAADNAQRFPNLSWTDSSESSNDFRSDIFTRPTLPMLEAIVNTTLGDCTADEDKTTVSFQEYVADLVGHEAALLVMSGTMGNQVALRSILRTPPHAILADHRAHIATLEGGGAASICGAMIKAIVPSNGHHLTLHDIQEQSILRETVFDCPTRVISLENTLSGTIMPLSDIRAISLWARAQNPPIHMHLDGARVWEAAAAGACTLREIGECFDSIQLCLTKALGAPLGSVVTGSASFIKRAKWSRHLLGGGIRSSGIITAPAKVAIRDVFFGGKIRLAQDKARCAARLWQDLGGKLQQPTETNMVWLDLPASRVDRDEFYALGRQLNLKISNSLMVGRLVFHYQISDAAFARLCDLFETVLKGRTVQSVNSE
ncbi:l-allo-threonine aldolase [Aspergillus caelatus]|uniref:L-allo-threonine aldolase n=1 Tax=Aspergillus caelatus TaxID=61420 RepID=A0A5N6ZP98_9EURO|nr:l-allo-threonine aldolase [Aspergillus caelatus]KAE8359265.1 l-allo-threonine aldolase [Aspergillus caelatus]